MPPGMFGHPYLDSLKVFEERFKLSIMVIPAGDFLDQSWTRTSGDFKAELERCGVEVVEYNMLEQPELVEKLNLQIDPYNPFSSFARFLIDHKEVSKEEFFQKMREKRRRKENGNRD
jgi:hypothetical protein